MGNEHAIIVEDVRTLELQESRQPVYDQPIGLHPLYADAAIEHYVVHYPSGMVALRHRHTAAHTIIVLDGRLTANGQLVGPGGYCHFPAGETMHHGPAAGEDCTFVILFHGPFDVEAVPD